MTAQSKGMKKQRSGSSQKTRVIALTPGKQHGLPGCGMCLIRNPASDANGLVKAFGILALMG